MERGDIKKRSRKWWIAAIVVVALVAAAVVLIPLTPLKTAAKARLTQFLLARLGQGAEIVDIDYGWRSITLKGVTLPLGGKGSMLRVAQVEVAIDPLSVIRAPDRVERMIHSVRFVEPELTLWQGTQRTNRAADAPWLPEVKIPGTVFSALARLDSLKHVHIMRGRVLTASVVQTPVTFLQFDATLEAGAAGVLQIAGSGAYGSNAGQTMALTGSLTARERLAEIQAVLEIPAGPPPSLLGTLPVALTTHGGRAALRATVQDSVLQFRASAVVNGVDVEGPGGPVHVAEVKVALVGDTLAFEPLEISAPAGRANIKGGLLLRGRGQWMLAGDFSIPDASKLHASLATIPVMQGAFAGQGSLTGEFTAPLGELEMWGDSLRIYGLAIENLQAAATITREGVVVSEATVETGEGRLELTGGIDFGTPARLNAQGLLTLAAAPKLAVWTSNLRQIRVAASGLLANPQVQVALQNADGQNLSQGTLRREGAVWTLNLESAGSGSSRVTVEPHEGQLRVELRNAHHTLAALFDAWRPALKPLESVDIRFDGDATSGAIEWDGLFDVSTGALWARVTREFHFRGHYSRAGADDLALEGNWNGYAGNGDPFEGQAQLTLRDSVLTVDHFFIDVYGDIKGAVDLRSRQLDLELSVADLEASKIPLPPAWAEKFGLQGAVSGSLRVTGALNRPQWSASLAIIDGSILGVPGYWMNLDATGLGLAAQVRSFEIGRDVRKILGASGSIDVERQQIAMTAELGAARAEDFLLALTGRTGLLTGDLDGRGAITGDLRQPDIEADLSVRNGELLKEFQVDAFTAGFRTARNAAGERVLKIPSCAFSKTGKYEFSGWAEMTPGAGGKLSAHVAGSGDFLDLLDQADRTFRSEGSDGTLTMDFGGTFEHPQFLGGGLQLRHGKFSYVDATPGLVATEMDFRVAASGAVEHGTIEMRIGDQWLRLTANCDSTHPQLEPLIIPKPRLCLGVLEIETGGTGATVRLPGFMKPEWTGVLTAGAGVGRPLTISGLGPDRLLIQGDVSVSNARFAFPFIGSGGAASGTPRRFSPVARWVVKRLTEALWQLNVTVGEGNHYDIEITGLKNSEMFAALRGSRVFTTLADYLDRLTIDAVVEPTVKPLQATGTIDSSTFFLNGSVSSARGRVEYLDQTFQIDYVHADFDGTNVMPVLDGRAKTDGVDDSTDLSVPVYLTMYQIDRETNTRQPRGRLDRMTFVLETDDQRSPEQVLALLGYGQTNVAGKRAGQLAKSTLARAIGRQWLDPLERRLERWTLLDEITLTPGGSRSANQLRQQRQAAPTAAVALPQSTAMWFLTGSQVSVGKYIARDVYLTYTGELSESPVALQNRLGLVHSWNLQYRIEPLSRDLVLDFAVEYDEIVHRQDQLISLKYSFALEP